MSASLSLLLQSALCFRLSQCRFAPHVISQQLVRWVHAVALSGNASWCRKKKTAPERFSKTSLARRIRAADGCQFRELEESCTGVFFPTQRCAEIMCTGACCAESGCVSVHNRNQCLSLGGEFKGAGTSCNDFRICDPPPADDNADADSEPFGICCIGTSCREMHRAGRDSNPRPSD